MSKHYPALLFVTNREKAQWYEVHEKKVKLLFSLKDPHPHYSDREGFFVSSGRGRTLGGGEPEMRNKVREEHAHQHLKKVAEKTAELWQENTYEELSAIVPEPQKNRLFGYLQDMLPKISIHTIWGNYSDLSKQKVQQLYSQSLLPS